MVKIVYSAIVKNESKIIKRCLDSLKSVVDYVCICDTYSSDNTVELIKEWGRETGVPTTVFYGEEYRFKNFGYNRTQAYEMAVKTYPDADYIFLQDADMLCIQEAAWPEDKKKLNAEAYNLIQKAGDLEYWNVRLLSAKLSWKCAPKTHEAWVVPGHTIKYERLTSLWFDDKNDGGCKSDKYERDKRLLLEDINDPNNDPGIKTRCRFYLAQTYKSLGDYKNSIKFYKERIKSGGWFEEIFYSYYAIGLNYLLLKREDKAVQYFLKAYNFRPTRSEPILELSKLYREKSEHNTAMIFINLGRSIPYPKEDSLFINKDVYDYLFLFELSVCGFYVGAEGKKQGAVATKLLLSMEDLIPDGTYELIKKNAEFYGIKVEEKKEEGGKEDAKEGDKEVKDEVKKEVKDEIKKEVKDEVKKEVKGEAKKEVKGEAKKGVKRDKKK